MVSAVDRAKRALITLLKSTSVVYGTCLDVTRDSPNAAVGRAYRKLSKKTHPDHGGNAEHQKALNVAHDEWEEALRKVGGKRGRPELLFLASSVQDISEMSREQNTPRMTLTRHMCFSEITKAQDRHGRAHCPNSFLIHNSTWCPQSIVQSEL